MSGPIVRTGTTPEFWTGWDRIFGTKKKAASGADATTDSAKKVKKTKSARPAGKAKKKSGKPARRTRASGN